MRRYFFDSYALIELNKGNINYSRYKGAELVTTLFNLMEFYYALLKMVDKNLAKLKFQKYLNKCVEINSEIIIEATEFRHEFNKNTKIKISYVDAIGYITAKKLNIKFLTGDLAFKNLNNVEYAK